MREDGRGCSQASDKGKRRKLSAQKEAEYIRGGVGSPWKNEYVRSLVTTRQSTILDGLGDGRARDSLPSPACLRAGRVFFRREAS